MKKGDSVTRMLAGTLPMEMTVADIIDGVVHCTYNDAPPDVIWTFDEATGAEIDDRFDWGPPPKMTGSFLVLNPPEQDS